MHKKTKDRPPPPSVGSPGGWAGPRLFNSSWRCGLCGGFRGGRGGDPKRVPPTPPSDSLGSSDDPQRLKGGRVGSVVLWSGNGRGGGLGLGLGNAKQPAVQLCFVQGDQRYKKPKVE